MKGNKYYKKYIEKLINSMPTIIKYDKTTKIDDGYGGYVVETEEVEHKVAIYDRTGRLEILQDIGKSYSRVGVTRLLAMADVDIQEDDLFTANGKQFRVVFVKPYFDICKQIEVEVVNNEN